MFDYERIRLKFLRDEAEGYLILGLAELCLAAIDRAGEAPQYFTRDFYYLRGEALRELKRYRDAIGPLRQAAKHDEANISIWLALGWCYKRTGRLDAAIASLDHAHRVEPTEPVIVYNLACYWSLARNKELALRYLGLTLELDSSYRDLIPEEPDFDPIRNDPDFQALISIVV